MCPTAFYESQKVVFTAALSPGDTGINALLLTESIRAFGGRLSNSSIWLYVNPKVILPEEVKYRLVDLGAELISYKVDEDEGNFFFMPEVGAAAEAERRAEGDVDTQVWFGANTMVLQEPLALKIPLNKNVGYRPVHITNIGSKIDKPLDDFWELIYEYCKVDSDRVFPVKTHVDGNTLRAYFNAGHLVVRPEKHLLCKWRDAFAALYRKPEFERFYDDERYRIFMHQAVLSAVILAGFSREQLIELPHTYNYPIHLYEEDTTGHRPGSIEELVTIRHEGFYNDFEWQEKLPARESLKRWISDRLQVTKHR